MFSFLRRRKHGRQEIVGLKAEVPLRSGKRTTYINLDNAASTPPLQCVLDAVNEFSQWYSSVHRGSGFKSALSTSIFQQAHQVIGSFLDYDLDKNTVILVKNTTEAINKLANRFPLSKNSLILTTMMEHHSNDLPWRFQAQTRYIKILPDGRLSLTNLQEQLARYKGLIKLVAVTGASNVTGYINPIRQIARLAHQNGAKILVDGAQLIPHRPFTALPDGHPEHIDFLALSGHKIYAPFGCGALIGPKEFFQHGRPDLVGGGTITTVTLDRVSWAELPEKEEAGSPNVIGAVALARALLYLDELGMDMIHKQEEKLTRYLISGLNKIPEITIYGESNPEAEDRLGVISLTLKGFSHSLLASILSHEAGIGVRSGCFCAHPYVHNLLHMSTAQIRQSQNLIKQKKLAESPGFVRISLGIYNTAGEVDCLLSSLKTFIEKGSDYYLKRYRFEPETGQYLPCTFRPDYSQYFTLTK